NRRRHVDERNGTAVVRVFPAWQAEPRNAVAVIHAALLQVHHVEDRAEFRLEIAGGEHRIRRQLLDDGAARQYAVAIQRRREGRLTFYGGMAELLVRDFGGLGA